MTPRIGTAVYRHLIYTLGLMRIVGAVEGAAAVDRAGTGKIHRRGDARAHDTNDHFRLWIQHGASSPETAASAARIQRMHDHYARTYPFSNETYIHGIALFTLLSDEILGIAGIHPFTEQEKAAQVQHWRTIGAHMNVQGLPATWAGMQQGMRAYEESPDWYRLTPEGHRCAEALIERANT
ncbi:oxygenase MpaB family protein [Streptomyces roseifaciens]|uniref:oxygenase MpaB family protein n=1 Tax=Streptomyces roseifaciens TaxID=1488406 RepID=UPI000AA205A7|nr:oxygenase MpaB family protein [Streptomyces roseifaciens]